MFPDKGTAAGKKLVTGPAITDASFRKKALIGLNGMLFVEDAVMGAAQSDAANTILTADTISAAEAAGAVTAIDAMLALVAALSIKAAVAELTGAALDTINAVVALTQAVTIQAVLRFISHKAQITVSQVDSRVDVRRIFNVSNVKRQQINTVQ